MIASIQNNARGVSQQSPSTDANTQYLSPRNASRLLGCSIQSLREWEKQGKISPPARTLGGASSGHRRYERGELLKLIGVQGEQAKDDGGRRVCVYVRVSSQGQKKSGSLQRQLDRMLAHVATAEGIEPEAIKVYQDCASSFGSRVGLNQLVDDLIANRVRVIYAEHADRFSRVKALTCLLEHLCEKQKVPLRLLDRDEQNLDESAALVADLISFATVIVNRNSSRRQAERRREVLSPEGLDFIRKQLASGRSVEQTCKMANDAGFRTVKGAPIGLKVIYRYLSREVQKLVPLEGVENSFATFVSECLKKKRGEGHKVQSSALHMAYNHWARKKGVVPLSSKKCGRFLRDAGYTYCLVRGFTFYDDVELVGGYSNVVEVDDGPRIRALWNGIKIVKCHYAGRKPKTGKQRNPNRPR